MNQKQRERQLLLQQLAAQQNNNSSSLADAYNTYKKLSGYASNLGRGMSKTGNWLSGKNSQLAQNIGSKLTNAGNTVSDASNYFKGFGQRTLGQGMQNLGQYLSGKEGVWGQLGNSLTNGANSLLGTSTEAANALNTGTQAANALSTGTEAASALTGGAEAANALGTLGTGAETASTLGTLGTGAEAASALGTGAEAAEALSALGTGAEAAATGAGASGLAGAGALAGAAGAALPIAAAALMAYSAMSSKNAKAAAKEAQRSQKANQEKISDLQSVMQDTQELQDNATQALNTPLQNGVSIADTSNSLNQTDLGNNVSNLVQTNTGNNYNGITGGAASITPQTGNNNQGIVNNNTDGTNGNFDLQPLYKDMSTGKIYEMQNTNPDWYNISEEEFNAEGTPTGYAANIADTGNNNKGVINYLMSKFMNGRASGNSSNSSTFYPSEDGLSTVDSFANSLRNDGYPESAVNGVYQGLNSGYPEIADWISQYNKGAEGQANPINIPVTDEEIALAREGKFNGTSLKGNADTNQSVTDNILAKLASGLGDLSRGYRENTTETFSPSNLLNNQFKETTKNADGTETTQYYNKNKMGRLGEALGTMRNAAGKIGDAAGKIGDAASNPLVQALIAGGLTYSGTNGNLLAAAGQAAKYGNQAAMNNMYKKALAKQGINVDPGMFGSLTSTDASTLMTPEIKRLDREMTAEKMQNEAEYRNAMLQATADKNNSSNEFKMQELDEKKRHNRATEKTDMIKAQNAGQKDKTEKKQTLEQQAQNHPDWKSDLAGYTRRLNDIKYANQWNALKEAFIGKYGVDPDKFIK